MEELNLREISEIFTRRRKLFCITAVTLFFLAILFAANWSNYRSTATVQIEQSFVNANITNTTANPNEIIEELADQSINQIQQKVTANDSLAQIIAKFNLYPGETGRTPIAALANKMRKKIKVEFISGTISNPAAASKQTAEQLSAIAFDLSFDYKDPILTQKVTEELVSRFLYEDLEIRRTQARETSAFLATQIAALEASMAAQEKAIAVFRAKNGESGPNALIFNQQAAANLNMTIENVESQITSNEGSQGSLRAQLAVIEPYSRVVADGQLLTTPAIQLKTLETQYATLTAQYGNDHPDVVKTRRQIKSLKAQIGASNTNLEAQITDTRANLAAAKSVDGPTHPDVVALERQLKKLEAAQAAKGKSETEDEFKADADNPAYIQVSSQLKAAGEQHKSLLKQREELARQKAKYEQTIAATPQVEQEMSQLTRDYENSQLRYRELKEKKMSADMAEQLEIGRKGRRLVVTNPPALPEDTHPRFTLLILGGFFISIMGAGAAIIFAEATTQNIHGANHMADIIGTMPLVSIPRIGSQNNKGYQTYLLSFIALLGIIKLLLLKLSAKPLQLWKRYA